tara:strand:- start:285 stop:1208 length:924 start_codon:yes stop_codon:yes gene_type:complete
MIIMLPNNMGMKKVAVTGGAGFIGSHLVDRLISLGVEVVVLDNLSTGKRENVNPKANLVICNIPNSTTDFLCEQTKDVDVIFHLAAKTAVQESIENPEMYNEINVGGTLKMLEICRLNNIPKFIFSSTSAIYGNTKTPTSETNPVNPISPYATTKLIGEKYCKLYNKIYGIDTVCLRYFNVYGNRMNNEGGYKLVMPIFKDQILNNKPLTINNDGEQRRDFVHVEDIVEANILSTIQKDSCGEIFNVGSGKNYSVNEIADMFGGEKQYGNKVIEPKETLADTTKIELDLGWRVKKDIRDWIRGYIKY